MTSASVPRNAAALLTGKLLAMGASFLLVLAAARLLGLGGFGRFALARMYFDLLLTLGVTGLSILITREIARSPSQGPIYLGTAAPLGIGAVTVGGIVLALAAPALGYGPDIQSMLWLACLALVPAALATLSEAVFVATGHARYVMLGACGEALLYAASGWLLLSLGYGGRSLFVALAATRTALAMAYVIQIRRLFGCAPRPGPAAFMARLCRDWRTFAFENWLANLTASAPVIVLSLTHHDVVVGLYAAASKIVSVGTPVVTSFTGAMFPYLTRLHQQSSLALRRVGEETLEYMLAAAVPAAVMLAIFADRVIGLLYGPGYDAAVPVLRVVIWVVVFNLVNPFVSHLLFARGEQTFSLRVGAVTAVVSLILAAGLIPRWGAVGAAAALLASSALACGLFCAAAFRPAPARALVTFAKAGLAAATLGAFLAIGRHAHPAALTLGALCVYVGALGALRMSSARESGAWLRSMACPGRPASDGGRGGR